VLFRSAGASVISLPSNEIYQSVQTGALDAAMTSSTSLISFRLEEVAKHLTTGRGKAYWYMLEPLVMSREVFEKLPKETQKIILDLGAELETFAVQAAKADDQAVADVYKKAGAKVYDLSAATVKRWQDIARETAWKDFASKSERCAKLIQLAEKVTVEAKPERTALFDKKQGKKK
jgi:TRAP-type C4-dicarboxylate transport system substrate-binding protein